MAGMLLLFCEESSLSDGAPLLLADSSLRADFDAEVVNIPSLYAILHSRGSIAERYYIIIIIIIITHTKIGAQQKQKKKYINDYTYGPVVGWTFSRRQPWA